MLKFKDMQRIKKLEETDELMDQIIAIPKVNGKDLSKEENAAIDLGVRTGFTIAKAIAEGKCDDMSPMEIATRLYETAFGMYIENVVLSDTEPDESEAKHAED